MKCIKLLGLALLALFALSAAASSLAAAELPEILPVPTAEKPLTFTSKTKAGTTPLLESESGKKITCKSGTGAGEFTTQDHGKALALATGCEEVNTKAKCSSNGVAGEVVGEGLIELVGVKSGGTLELGVWGESFALGGEAKKEDLKVKCGVLTITGLGSAIGLVDEVSSLVKTKKTLVLSHQTAGVQAIKTCELLKALCEKGPFDLKVKFTAEGAEELVGTEGEAEVEFAKEYEVHF